MVRPGSFLIRPNGLEALPGRGHFLLLSQRKANEGHYERLHATTIKLSNPHACQPHHVFIDRKIKYYLYHHSWYQLLWRAIRLKDFIIFFVTNFTWSTPVNLRSKKKKKLWLSREPSNNINQSKYYITLFPFKKRFDYNIEIYFFGIYLPKR